jgi:hypothetical protein
MPVVKKDLATAATGPHAGDANNTADELSE